MNQLLKSLVFSVFVAVSGLAAASPVNVNTATQSELESIKGIGPSKAKTIIAERLDGGHFQDANDLQKRVRGIGMKSVEKMVDNGLTIEAPSSFREPHGRTNKEGSKASRRGSRGQSGSRHNQDRAEANRRN
ncbi:MULTISPECIES: helix-hairpin-helix domain-containing protein [unclassified Polynucleobacter]|jgi:competence protein ComEA|uniref:ComEA family DNA-binding protein n=1 Tax=unclassified Polynucleobacter TaxID=2640945 RepID=UPI0008BBFEF4|nr:MULTISPECIES: helix-hairpin-helix domain-containing protein [unclassified Polynucleobacter]OHC10500.1 MAG: DNA-binding protein [Polynucleobacter sp. GWA2_45_21]HBK44343.1 DNA-binding protein [Polynucleobacter sp.]